MAKLEYFRTPCPITWCPGCGNFAIWASFRNACIANGWDNWNAVLVAGIGCHGHIVNFLKLTSFEGLHGRALPVATGIKLANHKLHVFAVVGDGDCLGEGGNHFIHACRRNHDVTVLMHDNALYALTTGQTSPTSPHGYTSKSTPFGNPDESFSPLALAIASGATFVARAYAGDIAQTSSIIAQAEAHRGFSFVDILQPCVTFNKLYTSTFYQQNKYYLDSSYDPTNKATALVKAYEWGERQIPLGVFYTASKPSFESCIPQIKEQTLVDRIVDRKMMDQIFSNYL